MLGISFSLWILAKRVCFYSVQEKINIALIFFVILRDCVIGNIVRNPINKVIHFEGLSLVRHSTNKIMRLVYLHRVVSCPFSIWNP